MNEIRWRCITFTPCGAKKPNIPNRIIEKDSASNKEVRNALNHQWKMRPRTVSVAGCKTTHNSIRPQNAENNDSILYHIDIRPRLRLLKHSTTKLARRSKGRRGDETKIRSQSANSNSFPVNVPNSRVCRRRPVAHKTHAVTLFL
jgi:hypothetical protein